MHDSSALCYQYCKLHALQIQIAVQFFRISKKLMFYFSDVGMITLNQYILLDPILLFFISGSTYAMTKFMNLTQEEFSVKWWIWLSIKGIFLGCAFSVKFVGLFVILLLGINTIYELWNILGDISKPFIHTTKHFLARAACLIILPMILYISFFYIHLSVLYKS